MFKNTEVQIGEILRAPSLGRNFLVLIKSIQYWSDYLVMYNPKTHVQGIIEWLSRDFSPVRKSQLQYTLAVDFEF